MKQTLLLLPLPLLLAATASAQPYEVYPKPGDVIPPELRVDPELRPAPEEPAPVKMPEVILISPALPPYASTQSGSAAPAEEAPLGPWTNLTLHFGGRAITPDLDKVAGVAASDSLGGGFVTLQAGRTLPTSEAWVPDELRVGVALSGLHANEYSLGSEVTVDTFRASLRSQAVWQVYDALYASVAGEFGGSRGEATLNLDGTNLTQSKVWGGHADLLGGLEARWKFDHFIGGIWFETGPALETTLDFDKLEEKGAPSVNLGAFDASGWRSGGGLFFGLAD